MHSKKVDVRGVGDVETAFRPGKAPSNPSKGSKGKPNPIRTRTKHASRPPRVTWFRHFQGIPVRRGESRRYHHGSTRCKHGAAFPRVIRCASRVQDHTVHPVLRRNQPIAHRGPFTLQARRNSRGPRAPEYRAIREGQRARCRTRPGRGHIPSARFTTGNRFPIIPQRIALRIGQ